jgi:hypothetical protein
MTAVPRVAGLWIYPIKSLDGVAIDRATVLASGALQGDREFALFDAAGNFVNGKRNDRVHAIRTRFELATKIVTLQESASESTHTFAIETEREQLEHWFSEYFGFSVQVRQNLEQGFPDDTDSPGPTIVSTATLEAIASWYPGLTITEVRRRFRANVEIPGVPAFWEDQLFAEAETTVAFQIGTVQVLGVNPCQRCVVVTRDSQTGMVLPNFQKIFVAQRRETLPAWAERSRFNHFFRLAINTRIPTAEVGKAIAIGDEVKVLV